MDQALKPGEQIKPPTTEEEVPDLVQAIYGLTVTQIKELVSYDDKNYLLQISDKYDNDNIPELSPAGYVCKILNSMGSQNTDLIEAQNGIILHIEAHKKEFGNILFPKLIQSRCGKHYVLKELASFLRFNALAEVRNKYTGNTGKKYAIRLLEFIPGTTLFNVQSIPLNVFEEIGTTIAKLDVVLKSFHHKVFEKTKTVWMLDHIELLEPFVYAVKNEADRNLVSEVVASFRENVMAHYDKFSKGIIHGDFNESNQLVGKYPDVDDGTLHLTGVLDFGDSCLSTYLFELAITITYAILQADDLIAGKLILSGYKQINPLTPLELQFLKTSICARLCVSLTMGAYTLLQEPENSYVMRTSVRGWRYLKLLWEMDSNALLRSWDDTSVTSVIKEE